MAKRSKGGGVVRRLRIRAKGLNIATLERSPRRRLPPGAAAAAAVALRKRE